MLIVLWMGSVAAGSLLQVESVALRRGLVEARQGGGIIDPNDIAPQVCSWTSRYRSVQHILSHNQQCQSTCALMVKAFNVRVLLSFLHAI